MRQKNRFIGIVAAIFFTLIPCAVSVGATQDVEAELTLQLMEAYPQITIESTWCFDYDGDGTKELFAVIHNSTEEWADYQIYFAGESYIGCVCEDACGVYEAHTARISSTQRLFYYEYGAGGSSSLSHCYYVESGKPMRVAQGLSGLRQTSGRQFTLVGDAYDWYMEKGASYGVGHTYKVYYAKWTGKSFREYTAKKISLAKFKTYDGADAVLRKVRKNGYQVKNVLKRSNGLIHVNLYKRDEYGTSYENLTLKLTGNRVRLLKVYADGSSFIEKYSYGGTYLKSIL